jgi:hypothetical protein
MCLVALLRCIMSRLLNQATPGETSYPAERAMSRPLGFGKLSKEIEARITACDEQEQLEEWMRNFATAKTLDDVGIERHT